MSEFSIHTPTGENGRLQITFEKQDDRWSHSIKWMTADAAQLVIASIEGSPEDIWPQHPPLQEISQEMLGDRLVLLGVGMAGRSHWSLSCSNECDGTTLSESVLFDLACLVKSADAGWLGSTYRLGSGVEVGTSQYDKLALWFDDNEVVISARSGDDWNTRLEVANGLLQIKPGTISKSPTIANRWAFAAEARKKRVDS